MASKTSGSKATAVSQTVASAAYERAKKYAGSARLMRTIVAVENCPELKDTVWPKLIDEVKKKQNTYMYQYLTESGKNIPKGCEWPEFEEVIKKIKATNDSNGSRVERERNNEAESIKANIDAGDFLFEHSMAAQAFQYYLMALDKLQRTPSKKSVETVKKLILCGLEAVGAKMHMTDRHVDHEIRNLLSRKIYDNDDDIFREAACLTAGNAAVALARGDFLAAANGFCNSNCTTALGNSWPQALLAEDVAIYGGLCALAAFSRADLKRKVIENDNFKDLLDLQPAMRSLIDDFYASDYAACMDTLEKNTPLWRLDHLLARNFDDLYEKIVSKAMVQYFRPYARADMKQMAKAFNMSLADLEAKVSQLIISKKIGARIDSQNKVMIAKQADERTLTFDKVLANGEAFITDVTTAMLRLSLREASLSLQPSSKEHGGGRRRGYGGGGFMGGLY